MCNQEYNSGNIIRTAELVMNSSTPIVTNVTIVEVEENGGIFL